MSRAARKPFLARLADYAIQNGGVSRITPRQARRLRHKDKRAAGVAPQP